MKRHFVYTCVLALLLVTAGAVWAAQPAVSPAPAESGVGAPAGGETVTQAPVPDTDPILGELFLEPEEVVDCCTIECYEEWSVCTSGCSSIDCKNKCTAKRDECLAGC